MKAPTTPSAPTTSTAVPIRTQPLATLLPKPDLVVTPGDIRFSPSSPKVGDALAISVTVRNLTKTAATGASILCVLSADGKEAGRKSLTTNVTASGTASVRMDVKTPSANQLTLAASITLAQDSNSANNRASVSVSVAK